MSPADKGRRADGMAGEPQPKVFTIPAGLPFVDVLAAGILDKTSGDPLRLACVTVLLPTRRARRSLAEAFLRQSNGKALLLPRMVALGDVDEDEILFSGSFAPEDGVAGADAFGVPPALSGLKRQLMLAKLVRAMDKEAGPEQAVDLAQELARLLDHVATERLSFDALVNLVPDDYAEHWQRTLEFLTIVTHRWPKVLEEEGALDPAERRNRLLDAQADAWRKRPPADSVIAAGSTGSIPATAALLSVVARLPQGAVVLPGLDRDASDDAWRAIAEHHPQFGMARLLEHLGVERGNVEFWPAPGFPAPSLRARLINAALAPASVATIPRIDTKAARAALAGIQLIECPTPGDEAEVIALVMRHALETPKRTAALVTPDRALARRVAAALGRWNIAIDDSAGQPLSRTQPGAFLLLSARMAADRFHPVPLLSVLKHPLAACGMPVARLRGLARAFEVAVLRGPRPAEGMKGLKDALRTNREFRDHNRKTADEVSAFLKVLDRITGPGAEAMDGTPRPFARILAAHVAMAEALAATDTEPGRARLWAKEAGEAAAVFINELADAGPDLGAVSAADYPAVLDSLMARRVVRPRYGLHPRLHIWGLLEARLQQADVMILGGLNENTWPPEAKASPWMSRAMLSRFGLPLPERRIGLSAHDFVQAFAAPEVILTRSERVEGTPQVPSRWLLRLENLLDRLGVKDTMTAGPWLDWIAGLDAPERPVEIAEPAPTPPIEARPDRISVTRVETWLRDPYAVYARDVLRLRPLDPIDAQPGAADRGIIVHDALERFVAEYKDALPVDAEAKLLAIGRQVFAERLAHPGVQAFWWPRFERIVPWFIANERRRRAKGFVPATTEVMGSIDIARRNAPFRLTARADRIDRGPDGFAIIDYKTGQVPSDNQVEVGFAPQLPLEAAIASAGGFEDVKAGPVAEMVYLKLAGGRKPGEERVLKLNAAKAAADAIKELTTLVRKFDNPTQPYLSQRKPQREGETGDYDHLARVREWRGAEDGNE
jgi:ATP-dependent helicase/nuclease subunit B